MKEHPILFSTQMVQAILEGRKTQTRRVVKTNHKGWDCQTMDFCQSENIDDFKLRHCLPRQIKELKGFHAFFKETDNNFKLGIKCPYGQLGDVLWVRETWAPALGDIAYKADYSTDVLNEPKNKGLWRPSIHMPKAAARIWLEIEEVKVELVQEITEEEAIAEGVYADNYKGIAQIIRGKENRLAFSDLWTKTYGNGSWLSNPWVWVIKFKVLSTTGAANIHARLNDEVVQEL